MLGHPSTHSWPGLEALPHWASNTEGVRLKRPEWGAPRLEVHLADTLRGLADAFARGRGGSGSGSGGASAAAAGTGAGARRAADTVPKLSPAGVDLLQVRVTGW